MRYFAPISLALAILTASFAAVPTAKDPPRGYVGHSEQGYVIAMPYSGGWIVVTPDGIGNVSGNVTDIAEAASAVGYILAGAPQPQPTSPLGACVAAAIAACQSFDRSLCWVQFGPKQCDFGCSEADGECDPAPHGATGITLTMGMWQ